MKPHGLTARFKINKAHVSFITSKKTIKTEMKPHGLTARFKNK